MNLRSIASRLAKLEARRSPSCEYLLVWRSGNETVADAVGRHLGRGRIICIEWLADGPAPQPRLLQSGLRGGLSELEWKPIDQAIRQRLARYPKRPEPETREHDYIRRMSDNELLYRIFGVTVL